MPEQPLAWRTDWNVCIWCGTTEMACREADGCCGQCLHNDG